MCMVKQTGMCLHMEHLNRMFKDAVSTLGPNTVDTSLQKTGKALKVLMDIQQHHTFRRSKEDN